MIDLDLYPILYKNRDSLKETSRDTSVPEAIEYMTSSELDVINFDLVKRAYANDLNLSEEVAASVDAVVPLMDGILFVEFKNGKVKNREIKNKVRDSLLIFLGIIGESIEYSRKNIDFIVVYNSEKNPLPNQYKKGQPQETPSRVFIAEHFMKKANEELILFDLERYKKLYFRNIHTYSKKQFEEYMQDWQLADNQKSRS